MYKKNLKFTSIHTENKRLLLKSEMEKVTKKIHQLFKTGSKKNFCPCCSSGLIFSYTEKFGYNVDKCQSCDHVFTNPFPTNEALSYFYNSEFKDFENQFFIDSYENRIPIFEQRLDLMKNLDRVSNVLDVGTAVGIFLEANRRSDERLSIDACDISKNACAYLRENFPSTQVFNSDITELQRNEYDAVTLWDTIEHIPDPKKLLDGVKNQLRSGGYFIFSTPNTKSFEWEVMEKEHVQILPPGHVNLYNTRNIEILLNSHGFKVQGIHTLNPSLDLTYIKTVFGVSKDDENSMFSRAANLLLDLALSEEVFPHFEKSLQQKLYAGNMVVISEID